MDEKKFAVNAEKMIRNWGQVFPAEQVDFAEAEKILADQQNDGSFAGVNYADPTQGMWDGIRHWVNLQRLTAAWRHTGKAKYKNAVVAGVEFWASALPENVNWWWQFIGVPLYLIRIINSFAGGFPRDLIGKLRRCFDRSDLISARTIPLDHSYRYTEKVLANRVSPKEIENCRITELADIPMEKFTGQNLVWTAYIQMWKGVFYHDAAMLVSGVREMSAEISIAQSGKEGIQADFSYHQHGPQQQFGNYGKAFFIMNLQLLNVLKGTDFALEPEKAALLRQYFTDGIRWTLYRKQMDILGCGRQLIKDYPAEKYNAFAQLVNECQETEFIKFFAADDLLEGSRFFYRSDQLIHRRNELFFSFKGSSSRVNGSETVNGENRLGLYLGCGVMQYKITGDEYDNMPALWDWLKLPGLTAAENERTLLCQAGVNSSAAVGGVCDDKNSGMMMHFDFEGLSYCKSVSAFDKTVVFNLSGIRCGEMVNTTVDSRRCSGAVKVSAGGKNLILSDGVHQLDNVNCIVCGKTAYTFLPMRSLTIEIKTECQPWSRVTKWADGEFTGRMLTIFRRGKEPFSYMISPAEMIPDKIRSVTESDRFHAVVDENSGIAYIYFFAPGSADIAGIGKVSCDRKAAVMINGGKIYLADVEQSGGKVRFTLNGRRYDVTVPDGVYAGKAVCLDRI